MARRKPKRVENISIIDFAHKGKTIGKGEDGFVYLIEGPVPGDVVNAIYYKKKKGLRVAKAIEYPVLSDKRTDPKCEHFGVCGGCKWQHTKYESQLYYKEKAVRDAIERIAHDDGAKVLPIVKCEEIFYYRNKIEYSFCNSRWISEEEAESGAEITDRNAAGFHRPGVFNKVVNLNNCHLQESLGNEIRLFLRDYALSKDYTFFDYSNHVGLLRNLTLRNSSIGEWMVTVVFRDDDKEAIEDVMIQVKETFPQITSLFYVINQKMNDTLYDQEHILYHGKPKMEERLGSIRYQIGPKSFFQTNSAQAKNLFDIAVDYADLKPTDVVYDLYTGLGSIALYVADKCKEVYGIEEIPQAIEDAKENQKLNGISNATFFAGDCKETLTMEFMQTYGKPDVVITDPPRAGMHVTVVETLLLIAAPKIVYISCNPATQARDLLLLAKKYELVQVTPVDMFPHTQHTESVALLKLKEGS